MNEQAEQNPWVIRTNFSNDAEWHLVRSQIAAPQREEECPAYVEYIDNQKYQNQELANLVLSLPDTYNHMFCFIVDQECIAHQEHPILVVGFYPSDDESFDRIPRNTPLADITTFRALPTQIQSIENNLSLANMDYEEFAESVASDGVFRGFPK